MSALSDYFLTSSADVIFVETLVISHPEFTKSYYIVRNLIDGVTLAGKNYVYVPVRLSGPNYSDDMDMSIQVDLGDVGDIVSKELQNVSDFTIEPSVIYKCYRSDDYSSPIYGPLTLTITDISFTRQGCSFQAHVPFLNRTAIGETFNTYRFPMLKGFQ